jgi:hypothetical protein
MNTQGLLARIGNASACAYNHGGVLRSGAARDCVDVDGKRQEVLKRQAAKEMGKAKSLVQMPCADLPSMTSDAADRHSRAIYADNAPPPAYALPATAPIIGNDGKIHLDITPEHDDLLSSVPIGQPSSSNSDQNQRRATSPARMSSPNVPRLNILMLVVGSRGDVQPFLVLAIALNRYGHRVRLATHSLFRDFVEGHSVDFFDIGGNPMELMAYMVANPGLVPHFEAWRKGEVIRKRRMMSDIVHASWRACFEPAKGSAEKAVAKEGKGWNEQRQRKEAELEPFVAEAIIANPPSLAHVHCAEKLGLPLHIFFT